MEYIELSCKLSPTEPWTDIFIAELAEAGFESFTEDEQGFKAYIPSCHYPAEMVKSIFESKRPLSPEKLSWQVVRIGGKNWNAVWESNFQPVVIDDRCHIRAPFHEAKDSIEYEIIIEPKMSFGTGHHETTSLVVKWLLETDLKGKSVLDMGCGTGILAILAAKMGADRVTAIDNYIYAWENTLENAERNHVSMKVLHGDASLLGKESFDVVIANITRNVLLEDMPAYNKVLNKGGVIFLSGFLSFDKDAIFAAGNSLGLQYAGEKTLKDWVSLKLVKPLTSNHGV